MTEISNGSVTLSKTTFGSIATYSCDVGFALQGSTERECEATGQWNGSEPSCISNQRGDGERVKERGREGGREGEKEMEREREEGRG